MRTLLCLFMGIVFMFSCKKDPGYGGLAEISGKVYAYEYFSSSNIIKDEGYAPNIRISIGVEGMSGVMDEVRTDIDGVFRFHGLRKGNYRVWVYSSCDTCLNGEKTLLQNVSIHKNKDRITLPDFVIDL